MSRKKSGLRPLDEDIVHAMVDDVGTAPLPAIELVAARMRFGTDAVGACNEQRFGHSGQRRHIEHAAERTVTGDNPRIVGGRSPLRRFGCPPLPPR